MLAVPAKIMRGKEQAEEIRQGIREEQARQQQALEQAQATQNIKNLGQSSTTEDTALGELKKSLSQ